MKKPLLYLALASSISIAPAWSQTTWKAGIQAAGTMNLHNGAFSSYDGLLGCGEFSDATTLGWTVGNAVDALFNEHLGASLRISYWKGDGDFESPAPVSPFVSMPDGSLVRMNSEYTLHTTLDYVTADIYATYAVGALTFAAGPSIGVCLRSSFEHGENITSPSNVKFANGSTSRTILSAGFDQVSAQATSNELRLGIGAAIGYSIPVAKRLELIPEIGGTYSFTNVLSSFDWKVHQIRAGLRLMYTFGSDIVEVPAKTVEPPPPIIVQAPPVAPEVDVEVLALADNGTMQPIPEILLIENKSVDVVPLLPNVFFDSLKATIPDRYNRQIRNTTSFEPNAINGDVLDVYHELLNIVGYRMNKYPDAKLTISGYREELDGETDPVLSEQRVNTVRDYLVNVWKINPQRLTTVVGAMPPSRSNKTVADGREENRRVELSSDFAAVLAPVRRITVRAEVRPASVQITPTITPVADGTIRIASTDGSTIKEEIATSGSKITWSPQASTVRGLIESGQRKVTISATAGSNEQRREDKQYVSLRRARTEEIGAEGDTLRERYRLVFFEFDDAKISAIDKPTVESIIERLRTTSKVNVAGYTDRIGNSTYNQDLSTRRATSVSNAIATRIQPTQLVSIGTGANEITNNNLPEGRMYNRTVIIDIATPRDSNVGEE